MNCPHCEEPILRDEPTRVLGPEVFHRECAIRMIAGSGAHQLGECSCFGGTREDPPGSTKRQGAMVAYEVFQLLNDPDGATIQRQIRELDL
jgi:hypothetical protein